MCLSIRLLETKLYVPKSRPGLVPRPRLIERLDRGTASKLALVSAPAGFGKTTLLADWLATDERPAAWLSLDRSDNDPASFWAHVVSALQSVSPKVGESTLALLQESQPPPIEHVLTPLLNDVGAIPRDIVLVLDDYHVIDAREVHEGLAFLLDHVPPKLHLVIAGRADPALPLAKLRARGELVEIRAADLRFTTEEAAAYLTGAMGLAMTVEDVAVLEERTEGWIAALQLAALSMEGRDDVTEFIAGFAGDDRYIVDFLVEEVVQRQPEQIQSFLLQTSGLGRLSAPLCDAVTGQNGGKAMLEALDRANLFLVPLDDRRQWYRYHQLFADVLHARLLDEQPDLVPDLHRRASAWFEQVGETDAAIDHALAAEDFGRAAHLVEKAAPAIRRERREATLRGWFEKLPEELFPARPVLSMDYIGALMSTGEIEGVEARLQDVERSLDAPADAVYLDEEEFRRLPGLVAVHRAGQSLMLGDVSATVRFASRALELAPADDHLGRGAASALLGLAYWPGGDLQAAHDGYVEGMTELRKAGHISDVLGCAITLADIRIVQGRLGDAMRAFEQSMQLATGNGDTVLRGTADMHVGMSTILRERGDLEAARQHLMRNQELGEHLGLPQNPHRWRIAMARIKEAEGDLDAAVTLLDDAERVYAGDYSPNVRPVSAMRARVSVRQGRLDDARDWAREQGLSADDDLTYLREFEHITLARMFLAQPSLDEATRLLEGLLRAAEEGGRKGSVIEILVLLALAHQQDGDIEAALTSLERALDLADPEGYVRIFVDEGPPMAALLAAAAGRGIFPVYVQRLTASSKGEARVAPKQDLVEPLSERELDVLRLLGSDLSGPDIARELVVSLNTVRTHTKSIYAKLGVNTRRAAVRRADELGLLAQARNR
jgi:LuxR family maltose regulon positive regulatory protein